MLRDSVDGYSVPDTAPSYHQLAAEKVQCQAPFLAAMKGVLGSLIANSANYILGLNAQLRYVLLRFLERSMLCDRQPGLAGTAKTMGRGGSLPAAPNLESPNYHSSVQCPSSKV